MQINQQKINEVKSFIEPTKRKLINHSLYLAIDSPEKLKVFMESHVFAVWDFMSLVKFLQREFTSINLPWVPPHNPIMSRLINEIVLDEESDLDANGHPISHFELYKQAMEQFGAQSMPINNFLQMVETNSNENFYFINTLPDGIKEFVETTFSFISKGNVAEVAAIFTFGREEVIPDMFMAVTKNLNQQSTHSLEKFIYYLERHIELDGDKHSELCFQMLSLLCGDDNSKWEQVKKASKKAIEARISLWDCIQGKFQRVVV